MRLLALSAVSILAMLAISWRVNRLVLYVVLFLTLAGSVYHATIVPPFLRKWIRYRSIRDVPTSRDLFVALAWGALLCLVAQADNLTWKFTPGSVLCFLWIFFLAYVRSLIFDLRDIEGDRILGRETLVTVIGDKNARRLILVLIQSLFVLSVVYFLIPFTSEHKFSSRSMTFIYQLPVLLYVFLFIRFTRNFTIRHASVFSLLADGQFYICGFLAWLVVR